MSAEDHEIDTKSNGDMGTLAEHLSIGDPQMVEYVGGNAAQPQQLDYDILVNLGKRDREAQEDLLSEDKNGSPSSSSEESPAKRSKMLADNYSEKKANSENWETMYQKLVAFKGNYGHTLVPKRYTEDPKLGTWVETQRVQYKRLDRDVCEQSGVESITPNKRLCAERLRKLQDIGFAWSAKNIKKPKSPSTVPAPRPAKIKKKEDASSKTAARNSWHDTMWEEYFEKLKAYKERHGDCLVPRKYDLDPKLGCWVETQRQLFNRDFKQLQEIETRALSDGDDNYQAAVAGYQGAFAEADASVDLDSKPSAAPDGVLMDTNTGILPTRRLTQERKDRLDELGFVWSLRHKRIADHWQKMFEQLKEYKDQHGDCLVPSRYEANVKLGKWVETQRYEYTKLQRAAEAEGNRSSTDEPKGNEDMEETSLIPVDSADAGATAAKVRPSNPRLTQERIQQLESIGFEWKVKHKMKRYYDKQWENMLSRLLAYKDKFGHCNVPKRYKEDPKLGTWVHTQRIQYRKFLAGTAKKEGDAAEFVESGEIKKEDEVTFRLTEERRKRLELVGFLWSSKEYVEKAGTAAPKVTRNSYDSQWDMMYERLLGFKERHGHCLVPKRYKEDPKLGTWIDTQRVQYKKMKKKLAEQGISYEGPSLVVNQGEEDTSSNMAGKPVVGRLTDDRIRRLENIGFTWSLRDDWQKHYDELKEFRNENGHCNVPARYATNRRLGIWVSAQRQQYKVLKAPIDPTKPKRSSPLTQERIDLLDQLGFTWTVRSRESSAPGEALNVAIDAEGKENEEDHLLAAGAMMANFRQHHHQAFVDAGVFDAPEDSVTPI